MGTDQRIRSAFPRSVSLDCDADGLPCGSACSSWSIAKGCNRYARRPLWGQDGLCAADDYRRRARLCRAHGPQLPDAPVRRVFF